MAEMRLADEGEWHKQASSFGAEMQLPVVEKSEKDDQRNGRNTNEMRN